MDPQDNSTTQPDIPEVKVQPQAAPIRSSRPRLIVFGALFGLILVFSSVLFGLAKIRGDSGMVASLQATSTSTPPPTFTPTLVPQPTATFAPTATPTTMPVYSNFSLNGDVSCESKLTFTSNPATLSSNDVQTILNTLNNFNFNSLPNTLQRSLSSLAGSTLAYDDCSGKLDITNTGSQTIQLLGGGFQLAADAQANSTVYDLVDVCDLSSRHLLPSNTDDGFNCGRGGGPSCSVALTIHLNGGSAGTVDTANFDQGGCPTVTLKPGDTFSVTEDIMSSVPDNYSLLPVFIVNNNGAPAPLRFQGRTLSLSYTDTAHAPCFTIDSNDSFFVQDSKGYTCQ